LSHIKLILRDTIPCNSVDELKPGAASWNRQGSTSAAVPFSICLDFGSKCIITALRLRRYGSIPVSFLGESQTFPLCLWAAFVLTVASTSASQQIQRPAITGFSQVAFYTSTPEAAKHFYVDLLGMESGDTPGVYIVGNQTVAAVAQKLADA